MKSAFRYKLLTDTISILVSVICGKIRLMKYLGFTLLLASIIFLGHSTEAQTLQTLGGQTSNLAVRVVPSLPGPNQTVNIFIESYATDLDRAEISWFLNNKPVEKSTGQKSFSFRTGQPGSLSNILIVVRTPDGEVMQHVIDIRPATVDLLWEAESYTPPFYRGKALYPYQGTVRIVAIPNIVTENGGTLNPKNLIYDWKIDGNPVTAVSGHGKNFISFTGSVPLKPTTISVEISSIDQAYAAAGKTILSPVQPGVVFYEDRPLAGVLYNKALTRSVSLANEEMKIAAIPYFSGVLKRDADTLKYDWQINNESILAASDENSLTFRQEKGVAGSSAISLQISNSAKIFQFAQNNLLLSFGNKAVENSF